MRGKCLPYKKLAIFSKSLFQNRPDFETAQTIKKSPGPERGPELPCTQEEETMPSLKRAFPPYRKTAGPTFCRR
jgi:hypothetical protein